MKIAFLFVIVTLALSSAQAQEQDAAIYARKLINDSSWGVISNYAYNLKNIPFGNVVSFVDGGKGTPFFYLTTLDYTTANYSMVDQRTSLSVSQFPLGTCGVYDPQEPKCGKVTLSGLLKPVRKNSKEERFALDVLFERHERFTKLQGFAINFNVYKLKVQSIYVVNDYKAPKFPTRDEYFNAEI